MPDKNRIDFVGEEQAVADMKRWAEELGPAVAKDRELADRIAENVKNVVPVLTGTLSSSVEVVDLDEEMGWGVAIGDGVEYAGWIEFGGSRGRDLVPEGRYLYPTAQEAEEDYLARAGDIAAETIGDFSWSKPST